VAAELHHQRHHHLCRACRHQVWGSPEGHLQAATTVTPPAPQLASPTPPPASLAAPTASAVAAVATDDQVEFTTPLDDDAE